MYWNEPETANIPVGYLINRNMRCIEIIADGQQIMCKWRLIETWDVLK